MPIESGASTLSVYQLSRPSSLRRSLASSRRPNNAKALPSSFEPRTPFTPPRCSSFTFPSTPSTQPSCSPIPTDLFDCPQLATPFVQVHAVGCPYWSPMSWPSRGAITASHAKDLELLSTYDSLCQPDVLISVDLGLIDFRLRLRKPDIDEIIKLLAAPLQAQHGPHFDGTARLVIHLNVPATHHPAPRGLDLNDIQSPAQPQLQPDKSKSFDHESKISSSLTQTGLPLDITPADQRPLDSALASRIVVTITTQLNDHALAQMSRAHSAFAVLARTASMVLTTPPRMSPRGCRSQIRSSMRPSRQQPPDREHRYAADAPSCPIGDDRVKLSNDRICPPNGSVYVKERLSIVTFTQAAIEERLALSALPFWFCIVRASRFTHVVHGTTIAQHKSRPRTGRPCLDYRMLLPARCSFSSSRILDVPAPAWFIVQRSAPAEITRQHGTCPGASTQLSISQRPLWLLIHQTPSTTVIRSAVKLTQPSLFPEQRQTYPPVLTPVLGIPEWLKEQCDPAHELTRNLATLQRAERLHLDEVAAHHRTLASSVLSPGSDECSLPHYSASIYLELSTARRGSFAHGPLLKHRTNSAVLSAHPSSTTTTRGVAMANGESIVLRIKPTAEPMDAEDHAAPPQFSRRSAEGDLSPSTKAALVLRLGQRPSIPPTVEQAPSSKAQRETAVASAEITLSARLSTPGQSSNQADLHGSTTVRKDRQREAHEAPWMESQQNHSWDGIDSHLVGIAHSESTAVALAQMSRPASSRSASPKATAVPLAQRSVLQSAHSLAAAHQGADVLFNATRQAKPSCATRPSSKSLKLLGEPNFPGTQFSSLQQESLVKASTTTSSNMACESASDRPDPAASIPAIGALPPCRRRYLLPAFLSALSPRSRLGPASASTSTSPGQCQRNKLSKGEARNLNVLNPLRPSGPPPPGIDVARVMGGSAPCSSLSPHWCPAADSLEGQQTRKAARDERRPGRPPTLKTSTTAETEQQGRRGGGGVADPAGGPLRELGG
ncbi:hypothetical protein V8E36_004014 [Tilletia maclaganii]